MCCFFDRTLLRKLLRCTLHWISTCWWSSFRGFSFFKNDDFIIIFGLKKGAKDFVAIFLDKEIWPYIILNPDCLIFKEINRVTNLTTSNMSRFSFFFLFSLFYRPIFCLDHPLHVFGPLFYNALGERRLEIRKYPTEITNCPSVRFSSCSFRWCQQQLRQNLFVLEEGRKGKKVFQVICICKCYFREKSI